jgi:hypothetical protein
MGTSGSHGDMYEEGCLLGSNAIRFSDVSEVLAVSETSLHFYQTTWNCNPEESHFISDNQSQTVGRSRLCTEVIWFQPTFLISWYRVFFEQLIVGQIVKKFTASGALRLSPCIKTFLLAPFLSKLQIVFFSPTVLLCVSLMRSNINILSISSSVPPRFSDRNYVRILHMNTKNKCSVDNF